MAHDPNPPRPMTCRGLGRYVFPALLTLAFLGRTPPAARADDLKTEHYDLHVETLDAADVGAMLEELHRTLTGHFGKAPEGLLRVEVYSTQERWHNALRADGQITPQAGGYYAPGTRKAYLFIQPSAYFTRQLILHEATHQFHLLATCGISSPGNFWYIEGIADYFGMHNWDGVHLETGGVRAITLEDYPAKALANFDAMKQNLEGLIAGTVKPDRPEAWALVHFLMHTHAERFRKLETELNLGKPPLCSWRKIFGPVSLRLAGEFRAWILKHQQPWKIEWIEWQERGDGLEGRSETSALAVLKSTPESLAVDLGEVTGETRAGVVFGYQSTDEFYVVQVLAGDRGWVVRRHAGEWAILTGTDVPRPDGPNRVSVSLIDGKARASINGRELGAWEAPGQLGLDVEAGGATFRTAK